MKRRDFSKICATTAISGFAMERFAWPIGVGAAQSGGNAKENSNDYIRREGSTWILSTQRAERQISLHSGRLVLDSLRNKVTGREYRDGGIDPDEIRITVDGRDTTSPAWRWDLASEHTKQLDQGELQLVIRLRGGPVEVTKHWVVYPETAIVREWLTIENVSAKEVRLQRPFFLNTRVMGNAVDGLELAYVSGAGNFNGSQLLKTERLKSSYNRTFDSNVGVQTGNYSAYLPLILVRDLRSNDGLAVGWDYMGHWLVRVGGDAGQQVGVAIEVAGHDDRLPPGARVTTPQSFTAAVSGDLDAIGNQILDWQYRYLWDFTNADYFAKTRWAVDWPVPWWGDGGTPCADNWGRRLSLDLRYVDLLREAGGDILWDDAGWYDRWGDWNGPDWRRTTDYLHKHGMRLALWQPTFLATPESGVVQAHPEWAIPSQVMIDQSVPGQVILDQSIAAVTAWQKKLLDKAVTDWNDFQWRFDLAPAAAASDTKLLGEDREFRELQRDFKTSHPGSGIDACCNGGRWISYDMARFSDSGEYTDGGVGP